MNSSEQQDLRTYAELRSLFEFVPPNRMRRHLIDLFFHALMNKDFDLAGYQDCVEDLYLLIRFLQDAEETMK